MRAGLSEVEATRVPVIRDTCRASERLGASSISDAPRRECAANADALNSEDTDATSTVGRSPSRHRPAPI
eukprot:scaffold1467_cov30-Tisochrysis_lutea.AAC.6